MNRFGILLLLAFLTFTDRGSHAQETGNSYREGCRVMALQSRTGDAGKAAKCLGFISALMAVGEHLSGSSRFCSPGTATIGQGVEIVNKFMDEHPSELHRPFALLAVFALASAWPCAK